MIAYHDYLLDFTRFIVWNSVEDESSSRTEIFICPTENNDTTQICIIVCRNLSNDTADLNTKLSRAIINK